MTTRGGRSAWLLRWDWDGDHAAVVDRPVIAAILPPQWGPDRVGSVVQALYSEWELELDEMLAALRPGAHNPNCIKYATTRKDDGAGPVNVQIIDIFYCGDNPRLYASKVRDLHIQRSPDGTLAVRWFAPRPSDLQWVPQELVVPS